MTGMHVTRAAIFLAALLAMPAGARPGAEPRVTIPRTELPASTFMSPEAKSQLAKILAHPDPPFPDIAAAREYYGRFNDDRLAEMRRHFGVKMERAQLGGVNVDVVIPQDGMAERHRRQVLINVHGGAFMWGAGSGALVEAIPIAATGRYKVVTVDYRLAPEHNFPAASDDVVAVYRALLREHRPEDIGIYGCSAGGMLTAQTVAQLIRLDLPVPGAIGSFCGSGIEFTGDSAWLAQLAMGQPPMTDTASATSYLKGVPANDATAYPATSPAILARFPPTLLLAGSRDFAASAVSTMHRRLIAAGADAQLVLFDGLWHAFIVYPDVPEAREAYQIITRFFDDRLGKRAGRRR